MTDLIRGTVTFLFTDLVVSTRLWDQEPDAMRGALGRHDELLRTAIEAHDGRVVKGRGDGVHAAFATAHAAVNAAIAVQRAMRAEQWSVSEPLRVRVGIHTGVAEQRDGDYFGSAVNRAARLEAIAHGGQVVCSQATADLARDSLPVDVALSDLGEHRLRDLSRPERVFQVTAPGLQASFAPLQSLDVVPGNLRLQTTSFVGRDADVAELVDAVRGQTLVTLTGVGGVGKTRLALQVAAELVAEFPDGVWVIELASVDDPGAVPDAAATVLGITQQPGLTITESIAATLTGRYRLLVFDNCEHVLDAAAELIEAIFARSSTVKVLATSREGLRVGDEHLWPVPSLDVRAGADSPCATLFVDRARAKVPSFSPTEADAAAIVEICRRLDGIPLAIELAASRLTSMSPTELRDRLDDRFRLLSGSRRGLERHQTLRHAVQWSYDLLEPAERDLLDRCSVFAGGFDLAAAVAVGGAGELDEYTVLDLLDALVRKSLVNVEASSGPTRYSMLETIRQFAEDQLAAAGESIAVRTHHARYFADQQAAARALWDSSGQRAAYDWLDRELPNLRTAFRWAADTGDLDAAAAIAVTAAHLGGGIMRLEPATWCEELLDPAQAADSPQLPELYAGATGCILVGRVHDGVRFAEAALALVDDPRYDEEWLRISRSLATLRFLYAGRADLVLDHSRAEIERTGNACSMAGCGLVFGLFFSGRVDEAMAAATELVECIGASANPFMLSTALLGYGWAHTGADPRAARDALRRALLVARDSANRNIETNTLLALARLEADLGETTEALRLLEASIGSFRDAGDLASTHTPLAILATVLARLGRVEAAATLTGFTTDPLSAVAVPEQEGTVVHLREVLGDDGFDVLAHTGATMEPTAAVRLALDEIEQALASDVVPHEGDGLAVHEA